MRCVNTGLTYRSALFIFKAMYEKDKKITKISNEIAEELYVAIYLGGASLHTQLIKTIPRGSDCVWCVSSRRGRCVLIR